MKFRENETLSEIPSYFNDVKKYGKGLTRDEEYDLGLKIMKGDKASRDKLVTANLRYVVRVAKTYRKYGVPFSDLISDGNIGLIKAAEKFDPTLGFKFITYAKWYIRSEMNKCVENYTGNELEVLDDSGNTEINEEDDELLYESINDDFNEEMAEIENKGMVVDELMQCLTKRERKIISLYYGLFGNEPKNLKEISDELGDLTPERIRQILSKSIDKLKVSALMSPEFKEIRELR